MIFVTGGIVIGTYIIMFKSFQNIRNTQIVLNRLHKKKKNDDNNII